MPVSLIPSFLLYAYTGAITPGPANISSLSAALRYGRKAAMRQWWGIFIGFGCVSLITVVIAYLLGAVLNDYVGILSWVGAAYILYLAWRTYNSSKTVDEKDPGRPTFLSGLFIQLTNVKIMVTCMTVMAGYVLPYTRSFWSLLAVGLFMPFTGPMANLIWLFAGASMQKLFANHRKAVDTVMAIALALCAVMLVWPH